MGKALDYDHRVSSGEGSRPPVDLRFPKISSACDFYVSFMLGPVNF